MYNPLLNNLAQSNAYLKDVDGIPPEQQLQVAIDKAQKGLIPFGVAVALKGAADTLRQRGAPSQMPEPDNPMMKIIKELQGGQGQPQMPQQQQMPPQMPQGQDPRLAAGVGSLPAPAMEQGPVQSMKGGGIVAFNGEDNDQEVEGDDRSQAEIDWTNEQQRLRDLRDHTDAERAARQRNETAGINNWLGHLADYWRAPAAKFNAYNPPSTPAVAAPAAAAAAAPAAANEAPAGLPAVTIPDYPAGLPGLAGSFSSRSGVSIPAYRHANLKPLEDLVATARGRVGTAPDRATFDAAAAKELADNEGYKSVLGYRDKLKGKGASLDARAKEQNRMLTAMLGFQWAANAAKPGARFLGSFAEAGVPYAKDKMALMQRVEDAKDALEDKQMRVAETLAAYKEKYDDKSERRYMDAKKELDAAQSHFETLTGQLYATSAADTTAQNAYNINAAQVQASTIRGLKERTAEQQYAQFSSDYMNADRLEGQAFAMPEGAAKNKLLAEAARYRQRGDSTYKIYQMGNLTYQGNQQKLDAAQWKALSEDINVMGPLKALKPGAKATPQEQMEANAYLLNLSDQLGVEPDAVRARLGLTGGGGGGTVKFDSSGKPAGSR